MNTETKQETLRHSIDLDPYEDSIGCAVVSVVGSAFALAIPIVGAIVLAFGCVIAVILLGHTPGGKLLAGVLAALAVVLGWKSLSSFK